MKKQFSAAIALFIFFLGSIGIYFFVQREKSLELHWLTENSRSQLDLMGDLLQNDLEKMKNQMAHVATLMESGQVIEAQKNLGLFVGVAALNPESSEFKWKTQVAQKNETTTAKSETDLKYESALKDESMIKDEWSAQWIQKIKDTKIDDSELKFYVSQSVQGEIRAALSIQANVRDHRTGQVNKVRLIGIRSQALFQEYIDKLKVQGIHTFLITQAGLTLAHSISEYVGNSMLGDRTYEQIRNEKSIFGKIITQDVNGDDILSFYVKLPAGKLTLVSQWRKELWLATDWTFYGQVFLIALALSLLFGALTQYLLTHFEKVIIRRSKYKESTYVEERSSLDRPFQDQSQESRAESHAENRIENRAENRIEVVSQKETSKNGIEFNREVDNQRPTNPPIEALPIPSRPPSLFTSSIAAIDIREPQVSMRILDKVVAALRAPLLSVLGHVQMARLNPLGGGLQSIENEIRDAKEVLDQVGQFSGQAHAPSVTVYLNEIVESALRNIEGLILRNNIKIIRELTSDLAIKCDIDDFKIALIAIFNNAIEAMENSLKKNLFIRSSKTNNMIVFEIEDTGEGISTEVLDKVMDPFFTTRSTLDHRGLGLSMVSGVFRQHSAQLQIKSKVGNGTTVIIKIPTSQEVVQTLASCIEAKVPKFEFSKPNHPSHPNQPNHPTQAEYDLSHQPQTTNPSEQELFKSLNLFDEEDSVGDFQFGKLEFSEDSLSFNTEKPDLSLGEKAAHEAIQEVLSNLEELSDQQGVVGLNITNDSKELSDTSSSSVSSKLKKKENPLSKIKVHIPRPEEKL